MIICVHRSSLISKRTRSRELRIWSAGCSTGQEPYNTAMVLDEYFGARKKSWDTRILATDISMNVLTKAKAGIYNVEDLKDVPSQWVSKYFKRLPNGQYQVCDQIRAEVIFPSAQPDGTVSIPQADGFNFFAAML